MNIWLSWQQRTVVLQLMLTTVTSRHNLTSQKTLVEHKDDMESFSQSQKDAQVMNKWKIKIKDAAG